MWSCFLISCHILLWSTEISIYLGFLLIKTLITCRCLVSGMWLIKKFLAQIIAQSPWGLSGLYLIFFCQPRLWNEVCSLISIELHVGRSGPVWHLLSPTLRTNSCWTLLQLLPVLSPVHSHLASLLVTASVPENSLFPLLPGSWFSSYLIESSFLASIPGCFSFSQSLSLQRVLEFGVSSSRVALKTVPAPTSPDQASLWSLQLSYPLLPWCCHLVLLIDGADIPCPHWIVDLPHGAPTAADAPPSFQLLQPEIPAVFTSPSLLLTPHIESIKKCQVRLCHSSASSALTVLWEEPVFSATLQALVLLQPPSCSLHSSPSPLVCPGSCWLHPQGPSALASILCA